MADSTAEPLLAADHLAHPRRRFSSSRSAAAGHEPSKSRTHTHDAAAAAAAVDPDTCRICRGEATVDEPLFYPCKCSGSIKYVHQDCLMEWLSHSQKKHCELCKTPFRFTKLYSPKMPKSLPVHVFIGHMAKYLFRNLLIWLRAALVISVWLCWLPYLMRQVWAFLFWVSDEGLGGGLLWVPTSDSGTRGTQVSSAATSSSTCPSSPLFIASTTVSTMGGLLDQMGQCRGSSFTNTIYGVNVTTTDSMSGAFLRILFGSIGLSTGTNRTSSEPHLDRHHSLLSDVSWLRNFTRYPVLNRTLINVLEGQIITLLVIVCFILVILVRDYVVQQQPEINMRAAFANENGREQEQNRQDEELADQVDQLRGPEESDDDTLDTEGTAESARNMVYPDLPWEEQEPTPDLPGSSQPHSIGFRRRPSGLANSSPVDEPHANVSNYDGAADPNTDEVAEGNFNGPPPSPVATVHEYLRIYRQVGGDPEKILKTIEEENLEETLGYWARITRSMIDKNRETSEEQEQSAKDTSEVVANALAIPRQPSPSPIPFSVQLPAPSTPEFSWPVEDANGDDKGKGKESTRTRTDEADMQSSGRDIPPAPKQNAVPSPLRPRSISDGPQRIDSINPLANNSWSFSSIPAKELPKDAAGPQTKYATPPPSVGPSSTAAEEGSPVDMREELYSFDPRPAESYGSLEEFGLESVSEALGSVVDEDLENASTAAIAEEVATEEREPVLEDRPVQRPPPRHGLINRVADFMWGDIQDREAEDNDAHGEGEGLQDNLNIQDLFVDPVADEDMPDGLEQDREAVEAAVAAGLDPEAIEDAEDFDGIMELIGMRGPIAGLFQNAIFCAVLVSVTIFLCVFLPYNIGRISVWAAMNPMRLVRMLFSLTKFVQDLAVTIVAGLSSALLSIVYIAGRLLGWLPSSHIIGHAMMNTWVISANASSRVLDSVMTELPIISASEMQNFSAISHESLILLKGHVSAAFAAIDNALAFLVTGDLPYKISETAAMAANATTFAWQAINQVPSSFFNPGSWVISFSIPESTTTVNPELAYWSGMDRFWAIICGYFSLSAIGGLYLRRGTPFSTSPTGQEWEASVIDLLNQASGVMKVILIISIEMLIFPLYCGLLLDFALLPLFEDTSLRSRLIFTLNYPLTSIFVHWFVGTGYMFHFALFVSMCRKIMRKGVLYFIRDPDDPEFHPVRDVLERNVMTQLRKIAFSAFVYGALVIVCLGGVVWGLSCFRPHVLPIHYSSNEPVLEFPIDLLFYNFLMPLAVKFFKPSDALHAMYTWWFRKCARGLRLTWFLFGERQIDEEGILALHPESPQLELPWWRRSFLEVNKQNKVVPKTWEDAFDGGTAKPVSLIPNDQMIVLNLNKQRLVDSGQLIDDGHFVRTPASDQVKIPKGKMVFMTVSETNCRLDGKDDLPETDIYSTDQYQLVYIPPHFRLRIFLFILFIWLFAAVTGVGFTILPLVFGRKMFKVLIPAHIRTNDIYAFSIGIYVLGSAAYSIFHLRSMAGKAEVWLSSLVNAVWDRETPKRVASIATRVAKLAYTYFFLLFVFPMLVAVLMECYLIIPLHTYMYPLTSVTVEPHTAGHIVDGVVVTSKHTTRVIQSWTLGLLYLKLGARIITGVYEGTRMASAVRAVLRRGWLQPDVGVLTRAFVIPGLLFGALAIFGPGLAVKFAIHAVPRTAPPTPQELATLFRVSYPLAMLTALTSMAFFSTIRIFKTWTARIRDEAYLIGERLHNFGVGAAGAANTKGPWRVRGARL